MTPVTVFVDHPYKQEIVYTLRLMEDLLDCQFNFTENKAEGSIEISDLSTNTIQVSTENFQKLLAGETQWQNFFSEDGPALVNGKPDYIFSVFYMVNSFQEYRLPQHDQYGRIRTADTWQHHFNCIRKNVVSSWILEFAEQHFPFVTKRNFKTRVFLSHDIDSVFGSALQDSYYCIRKFRFGDAMKIFLETISGKPGWLNMDRIMKIENEYDFRSTFFWIATKNRGRHNLENADYDIRSERIKSILKSTSSHGWSNGLHKSAATSSFSEELEMLPEKSNSNRYHYLLFNLPFGYEQIADSGLKLDSSLGFADNIGFRNSYSLPFKPYNINERKSFDFVECPLHIMDTTYHFYNKLGAEKLVEDTITFIENNNSNSIATLLFHNNYVTDYKFGEYMKAFKKLLTYFYESEIRPIGPDEIIKTFLREY